MTRRTGRCLCGATRYTATVDSLLVRGCHCSDCRRWTGSAVYVIGPFKDLTVADGAPVRWVDTSPWAERGFCGACGSALFWRDKVGSGTSLMIGSLDDPSDLQMEQEIFADERLPVLAAAPGALQRPRSAVIARYAEGYSGCSIRLDPPETSCDWPN